MDENKEMEEFNKKRLAKLARAEWVDAWRIVPRFLVSLYVIMVGAIILWFMDIPTYVQMTCQQDLLLELLDRGMSKADAEALACHVTDVVGGPTTTTTVFITTICGLATGIFGLYTNTGREWSKGILRWRWRDVEAFEEVRQQNALKEEIKNKLDEL